MYFDKYKETVYAGLITFVSVGTAVAPTALEFLIKKLTYKYAMLVRAAAFLLAVPVAFVYRVKSGNFKNNQAPEMEGNLKVVNQIAMEEKTASTL